MSHSLIRRLALAGTAAVGAFALATPRLLRLGATKEEAHRPMPGDDEVPEAQLQGTRAVTINAPPEDVWPWIAQIGYHGYGRAGWYAMDRARRRAALVARAPRSDRRVMLEPSPRHE